MPTDTHLVEDALENDLDSELQQIACKQPTDVCLTQSTVDVAELESETLTVDKSVKFISCQRSSNRLTKRPRKDRSIEIILKKADNLKDVTPSIRSKTRRPWELWSVEDKNAFFEALCEYGKDFESIQSYIAQRSKKKGAATNIIKNKDQVRHFYYRTWHKISKFLEISESVQKQTQELYGLINYAELRKKIGGCLNEKNRLKLNELVFSGVTTVKYKGKKLRIKTPVCRALKKLNNFTDSKEPDSEKLPKDIFVEFRPHTNNAWLQVQNLAQNPRVRTKVCLQKRLGPVIEYLQKRWRPYRLKRKEQVLNSLPNYSSDELCDIQPLLRVKPPRGVKIFPLSMSAIDTASSSDVCLEKYLKLSHNSLFKDVNKSKKIVNTKPKFQSEKQTENEIMSEKADNFLNNGSELCDNLSFADTCVTNMKGSKNVEDNNYINILTPPTSVPEVEQSSEQNFAEAQVSLTSLTSVIDSSVKQSILSNSLDIITPKDCGSLSENDNRSSDLLKDTEQSNAYHLETNLTDCNFDGISLFSATTNANCKKDLCSEILSEKDKNIEDKQDLNKNKNISENSDSVYCKTIRHGWTADEAGFLTFGELYLLFGKPAIIILEYEFEYLERAAEYESELSSCRTSDLSILLNKVFEVAHVFFADPKHRQLPGKQHSRSSSKSTKLKTCGLNEKSSKDFSPSQNSSHNESNLVSKDVTNTDILVSNMPTSSNDNSSQTTVSSTSDKHVFVRPIGTAPRNVKHPDQNSLKEELGKLLPCTRRGCRVRRKPLVVQRPLLPREGMRPISGPRPMTVVHFVPSVSPLTTVMPSVCCRPKNKIAIPPAKQVVKILPPATSVDIHPIQVPVKQIHSDSGQQVILEQNSISPSHIIANSTTESLQILNNPMTQVSVPACDSTLVVQSTSSPEENKPILAQVELVSSTDDLNTLNIDLLTRLPKDINESKENYVSLSQLSLSDAPIVSNVSPSTSFLDEFGLSKNSMYDSSNIASCLNTDIVTKECTSSENSANLPFRMNSSDIQWFSSESTELSLNTFLNSMESPTKMASTTSNIGTENSNLDPIGRLAPVVDSHVRCLLDECSIDFITKFEDLADVINNSSSSDSKQT